MLRIIKLSDEEQLKLYMKSSKKELAEMLLNANKVLEKIDPKFFVHYQNKED